MKYVKFTIKTVNEAVDILSSELDAIGIEGIEIDDSVPLSEEDKKKMFVDILPDPVEVNDIARVSFYQDASECDRDSVLTRVREILDEMSAYTDIGEGSIEITETKDEDWINNWKEFFKPFQASKHIYICPTWIDDPDHVGSVTLRIDPGIAFGTGSHETTKLCIQALDDIICGENHNGSADEITGSIRDGMSDRSAGDPHTEVLDIGCGSGILSIASLLLGVHHVTAVDIDEMAVSVAAENFETNGIEPGKYDLLAGNLLEDRQVVAQFDKKFDIILANILPDVIVPLTPIVPDFLAPSGVFITSGILITRAAEVLDALKNNGFTDIRENRMGEWTSFIAMKK
ncbi:MAG: 50S ribosomal protein L11 methyltransferase [Eubacterium sp.]|nr:50S ribosomal protein L11 methyltransferase [Eubacterium sp.]